MSAINRIYRRRRSSCVVGETVWPSDATATAAVQQCKYMLYFYLNVIFLVHLHPFFKGLIISSLTGVNTVDHACLYNIILQYKNKNSRKRLVVIGGGTGRALAGWIGRKKEAAPGSPLMRLLFMSFKLNFANCGVEWVCQRDKSLVCSAYYDRRLGQTQRTRG